MELDCSVDPDQRACADALTEALVAGLAQIDGTRVISRTSSMQYRQAHLPLPGIARQLGATHVLEGSVVRDGSRLRITAQLIEASPNRHVGAHAYDRTAGDALRVQADVARRIAHDLAGLVGTDALAGSGAPDSGTLTTGGR